MNGLSQHVWTFPGGKFLDLYIEVGAGAQRDFVVPAGKRWLVFFGRAERDANATFEVQVLNAVPAIIGVLGVWGAGVTYVNWPSVAGYPIGPFPLESGWRIRYVWGVAQVTPEVSLVVLEIDAP